MRATTRLKAETEKTLKVQKVKETAQERRDCVRPKKRRHIRWD